MFENLQDKLEGAFKNLKGQGKLTELNIAATVKDIRRALVDADVNYKIAKEFTDTIKDKAMGQNVLTSVAPGQLMVKIYINWKNIVENKKAASSSESKKEFNDDNYKQTY